MSLLGVLLFLILLILTIIMIAYGNFEKEHLKTSTYQISSFEPSSNKTTFGFVELHKKLRNDEYVSYFSSYGEYFVISNLADGKYKCTGKCSCNGDVSRRTVSVLSNGLIYMVTVFSAILATQAAVQYFQNQCVTLFANGGETCDGEVESEVEDCLLIDGDELDRENQKINEVDSIQSTFWCRGHCVNREEGDFDDYPKKKKQKIFENLRSLECEAMRMHGIVEVEVPNFLDFGTFGANRARIIFRNKHLTPYCNEAGSINTYLKAMKKGDKIFEKDFSLCDGRSIGVGGFDNVWCRIDGIPNQDER